ncbi:hypothetical protein [Palleronia rufa]|uniref:hypothetical protein n=1 Tax=Palleronia rufa TaxID=1530186 RepID=UPI00056A49AB|nr:hypothetical protein [Palleronia rufa]
MRHDATQRETPPTGGLRESTLCHGTVLSLLFSGQAPSESRIEMLLDRLDRTDGDRTRCGTDPRAGPVDATPVSDGPRRQAAQGPFP